MNIANLVVTLSASTHRTMDHHQVKGMMYDLIGKSGYKSSAKSFFDLIMGGKKVGFFHKHLITITGDSPITHVAVQKLGGIYTISVLKSNGLETHTREATQLINLITKYEFIETQTTLSGRKGSNLVTLGDMISKVETEYGQEGKLIHLLDRLTPNTTINNGRFRYEVLKFDISFIKFGGLIVCDIYDQDGFSKRVSDVAEIRAIIWDYKYA